MRDLVERLENWGNVVRVTRQSTRNYSAAWAKEYYRLRDTQHQKLADELNLTFERQIGSKADVVDAMLIERAMQMLMFFDQKELLKFAFVHRYPDCWIKTKLKIRGKSVDIVRGKAYANLKLHLASIEKMDKMRNHNNLHAGLSAPIVQNLAVLGTAIA